MTAGLVLVVGVTRAGSAALSLRPRCLGDCRGTPTDCAGIDRWIEGVRWDEAWPRGTSQLRFQVHRARVLYRGGHPCGAKEWALTSFDPRIEPLILRAEREDGTLDVAQRYWNPHADGDVVFLLVRGAEVSAIEATRASMVASVEEEK